VLHNEEKDKYDTWFPEWRNKCSEGDQKLLTEMNAHRRAAVHLAAGANTTVEVEMVPMVGVRPAAAPWQDTIGRASPPLALAHSAGLLAHEIYFNWSSDNESGLPVHYFKFEGTKVEAVDLCNKYLELLGKIVQDFLEAHR